ncbi:MAG: CoA-binding protein [Bacteroidota bacterium]
MDTFLAAQRLHANQLPFVNVGIKQGELFGVPILQGTPALEGVDTVTLYLGSKHQPPYYDWLMGLQPRRIIFNPGTENPELAKMAREQGIETVVGCTLVMLASGQY